MLTAKSTQLYELVHDALVSPAKSIHPKIDFRSKAFHDEIGF